MTINFSKAAEDRVEEVKKRYPQQRSAVMFALYVVQEELGYINDEGIEWVAEKCGMSPIHVRELVTFYTMYRQKPLGKYHIQVCRTLSCALCGAKKITDHLHKKLGLKPRQVSADGMWSFEEVECLGSCGTAPMCEINDTFFENLTVEKLDEIMNKIAKEKPNLSFSSIEDKLGDGLKGYPKSEVI